MIIELSKDKSLKALLLKANIDDDTMLLVKSDADIRVIKNSLIDNINDSNIVQYRKYIAKAEDEEDDLRSDEEIRDDLKDELDETLSTTAAGGGGTGISQTKDLVADKKTLVGRELYEENEKRRLSQLHKKYHNEINKLKGIEKELKAILKDLIVKRSKGTLTGYRFLNYASWKGKKDIQQSNTIINVLTILKKEPDMFNNRYKEFLNAEGTFIPFIRKSKKGKETKHKSIKFKPIIDSIINSSKSMIGIEDTSDRISLYDALVNLHINTHEKNPSVKQNKPRWGKQTAKSKKIALSMNKKVEDKVMDMKGIIAKIQQEYANLQKKEAKLSVFVDMLESLLEGGQEGIIARKISRLTAGIKELYEENTKFVDDPISGERTRETKETPKMGTEGKIHELNEFIKEIQAGRADAIEEATEEIETDLKQEQTKLEKVRESIERINQFRGELEGYINIIEDMPNAPAISRFESKGKETKPSTSEEEEEWKKEKEEYQTERAFFEDWERKAGVLLDLGSSIESIHHGLKKMSKLLNKLDESEAEDFKEWVQGKAGVRPDIRENRELLNSIYEGNLLDTYDNRDIVQVERLSHRLIKLYEKVDKLKSSLRAYIPREITRQKALRDKEERD